MWLSVKEIPWADEFHHDLWRGERKERVFVSFRCFSCTLGSRGYFFLILWNPGYFSWEFCYKAFKDIHKECIHRIVCRGRDVLAVLPTGLGKSTIYQLIPKVLFRMGHTTNTTFETTAELLVFCWLTKWNGTFTKWQASHTKIAFLVLLLKLTHYERNRRIIVLQNKPYFCRPYCDSTECKFTLFVPCVIPAHKATSDNSAWFIGIDDILTDRYFMHLSMLSPRVGGGGGRSRGIWHFHGSQSEAKMQRNR